MSQDDSDKLQPPKLFRRRRDQRPAEPEPEAAPEPADTKVMEQPADEPATAPTPEPEPGPAPEPEPAPEPAAPRSKRPRLRLRRPRVRVNGYVAAGLSGLVSGAALVALTWLCLQATGQGSSIGGKVGLPLLAAVFVVGIVIGALALRLLGVASPATTAFLGTGAVAVVAMFGIGTHLDSTWGAGLVVVIAVAAYLLARWFVARFIEA